jgi:hypothetical protein
MANRLLTRRRLLLAKTETTYGTDAVPTGLANAILVKNLNVTPLDATLVSRDLVRAYLGANQQLLADAHAKLDFEVEIAGAGTAGTAPGYGPLLRACGMSETILASTSVTYAPVSTAMDSATLYFQQDGAQHSITGARGDVEITFKAKGIPTFKFSFVGIYNPPTATSLASPTYTKFQSPLVVNSSNTPSVSIAGYAAILDELSLKLGNTVDFRSLVGAQYVQILDRQASGQVTFEAVTPDVKDFFGIALGNAYSALSLTHGATAGNIVQLSIPTADLNNPTYTDNSGVQMMQIPYTAVPNAGNDEFSIVVK